MVFRAHHQELRPGAAPARQHHRRDGRPRREPARRRDRGGRQARRDLAAARHRGRRPGRRSCEREIEKPGVRLLALRQPMARDLRQIVAALKISHRSRAHRRSTPRTSPSAAMVLDQSRPVKPVDALLERMGELVAGAMIKDVLDAYVAARRRQGAARCGCATKRSTRCIRRLFRELLTYMMEDPRNITACTHLLFMAKNLERIGDHATNIAETLYFLVNGTPLPQMRPKRDRTSLARSTRRATNERAETSADAPSVLVVEDEARARRRCCATTSRRKASTSARRATARRRCCRSKEQQARRWCCSTGCCRGSPGIEVCRQIRRAPADARPAGHHADRARRGGRPRARPRQRRRRLRRQAVQRCSELIARLRAVIRRARPGAGRRDAALRRHRARSAPRTASPAAASRSIWARPNSACCDIPDASGRAACSRASSCWTRSGAATSRSSCAPSTSISAACARRSTRTRPARPDPHRALRRLRAQRPLRQDRVNARVAG